MRVFSVLHDPVITDTKGVMSLALIPFLLASRVGRGARGCLAALIGLVIRLR
jgi:membrane protein YqaA with SNARE-associated domain